MSNCDSQIKWPAWVVVAVIVLGLDLLLHGPSLLLGARRTDLGFYLTDLLRLYYLFSLDLFGLVCLLAVTPYTPERSRVRYVVVGSVLFLLVYMTYDAVVVSALNRSPIFYADASQLVGAGYLLLNGGVPRTYLLGVGAVVGALGFLMWILPGLVRSLHRHLRTPRVRRGVLQIAAVLAVLVGFASVTNRGIERQTYQSICFSTAECVARNVHASLVLDRELAHRRSGTADSTYLRYDDLRWIRPPSLYVVVIESYGSALATPPHRTEYNAFMGSLGELLAGAGWQAATARSEAPVFGGLSWLSIASLFLGTSVEHQPTFELLRPTLDRYPHLVRLLRRQGYETAALQPPVRARPGLSVDNHYRFDRTFYLEDLDYEGPSYGWGIVPDQYSLAVAHEQFVEPAETPFFLFFETVTPHVPWDRPTPPLVHDPGVLNSVEKTDWGHSSRVRSATPSSQLENLFRNVQYDWRVLSDYLRTRAPKNSLVVVLGDHQPHAAEQKSTATPLHVLSRDERLVRRFETYGFKEGLRASPKASTLHHAAVYSLLVRVLTAHVRPAQDSMAPLPPYRPQGVARAALHPVHSSSNVPLR